MDGWRETRCYSDVSFSTRQRHVIIYDVRLSLKGSGETINQFFVSNSHNNKLFQFTLDQMNVILLLSLYICCGDVNNA